MVETEEGREKMMEIMYKSWKNVEPKGERTCGFEEMKKMMGGEFADQTDKMAGGHWIWDMKTAKADWDFTVHVFGENGRISFQQWLA